MFAMKKNIFQKADLLRQIAKNTLGRDCTDVEILSLFNKASSFDNGVTKTASDEVRAILSSLTAKGINANTAYKYLKMSLMPTHIKERLYGRKISTSKAFKMARDENYQKRVELENTIFEYGMKAIRGLRKCH
ncbi:hypothetical protein KY360_03845 [Candidatus Woesearchaeota archaeon]|nr:hypothetical protein [Candidatus Woesearchaeota archaeon]